MRDRKPPTCVFINWCRPLMAASCVVQACDHLIGPYAAPQSGAGLISKRESNLSTVASFRG